MLHNNGHPLLVRFRVESRVASYTDGDFDADPNIVHNDFPIWGDKIDFRLPVRQVDSCCSHDTPRSHISWWVRAVLVFTSDLITVDVHRNDSYHHTGQHTYEGSLMICNERLC